ncbi:MAG: amidase [Rhodobacteraceae bacterium]|nr:amidase [Paracoccaceae bacterium]
MADAGGDDAIGYATAGDLLGRYGRGDLSPVEVTAAILGRVAALEPRLNAFSRVLGDEALAAARVSEGRWRRGEARPLEGVPVTIKDICDVAGVETETGCHVIRAGTPAADNPVAARLRAAGAVLIGKTTMSELGWSGLSRNPVTGVTHNPWGRGLNAGASSAGAGVAAAAGYGPLHLGSDGAGSIRMPAHFCGVFGLKPTYGRLPYVPVSNNDNATVYGPMARTVADAALLLAVTAGPHPLDHTSCEAAPLPYAARLDTPLKGRRVAFSPDLGHARVDPEVAGIVRGAVEVLARDLRLAVEEVRPAWGPQGPALGRFFWSVLWSRYRALIAGQEGRMGPDLVACIRAGAGPSALDYLAARERKFAYVAAMAAFLEEWDYLVTPVASVAAFPVERLLPEHWPAHDWDWLSWAEFLYPFNLSGQPAASVPCGFTAAGLPVGLQIVARRFDDLAVLGLARAFEAAVPLHRRRPPLSPA